MNRDDPNPLTSHWSYQSNRTSRTAECCPCSSNLGPRYDSFERFERGWAVEFRLSRVWQFDPWCWKVVSMTDPWENGNICRFTSRYMNECLIFYGKCTWMLWVMIILESVRKKSVNDEYYLAGSVTTLWRVNINKKSWWRFEFMFDVNLLFNHQIFTKRKGNLENTRGIAMIRRSIYFPIEIVCF